MTEVFDDQAAVYDRWYATPLGHLVDRVEKEALFALLPNLAGCRVLEVGCGTGNISQVLASRGARVVGLDVSGPMLAAAQSRARQHGYPPDLLRGLAGFLPFPGNSFDGVISVLALDFVADRQDAVREMVRVLRPRGFLALALLNRYSLWTLKRVLRAFIKPSLWRQVRFATSRELGRLLAGHPDLEGIAASQAVYFPPWATPGLVRRYPALERLGRALKLPHGAFLVAAAKKRGPSPPGEVYSQT
jgi:ubiquinone/menaquinone biosynthesis C-methylase UbiE